MIFSMNLWSFIICYSLEMELKRMSGGEVVYEVYLHHNYVLDCQL